MATNDDSQKPFAVIILTTLRVARFQTKDEFYDAMRNLKERETPFIPVKYHHGVERYILPDTYNIEELSI